MWHLSFATCHPPSKPHRIRRLALKSLPNLTSHQKSKTSSPRRCLNLSSVYIHHFSFFLKKNHAMEEEEERKRASEEDGDVLATESPALKRLREAELEDEVMAWLSVEDSETDSVSEILKLLDDSSEAATSASTSTLSSPTSFGSRVRFSDNPYSSALIFQSSSSYVTINGNEESCGSSFSESESSVMASVDMGGIVRGNGKGGEGWEMEEGGGAWGRSEGEARGWMMDFEWNCERVWEEEQLASFMGEEEEEVRYLF